MKKQNLILVVTLIVTLAMMGCASTSSSSGSADLPPWINEIPAQDVIWGIGSAKQSSTQISMTTAEARARVAIARTLDSRVSAMFVDYNHDAGNVGSQANASMQQDVSRQITNINLSGAVINQRWSAPDGTWWIRVEYKKTDARNAVASILGNEEAAFAEFKAQQALQMLDSQLNKNEQPLQVNE